VFVCFQYFICWKFFGICFFNFFFKYFFLVMTREITGVAVEGTRRGTARHKGWGNPEVGPTMGLGLTLGTGVTLNQEALRKGETWMRLQLLTMLKMWVLRIPWMKLLPKLKRLEIGGRRLKGWCGFSSDLANLRCSKIDVRSSRHLEKKITKILFSNIKKL
jgi:hypothetical protein